MQSISQEQLREIEDAIKAGRKIEAIKLFREHTDVGLKEAKDAVERIEAEGSAWLAGAGGEAMSNGPLPAADRQKVVAALNAGKKIEAIRIYREATGVGLKEAKDAVDAMPAARNAGGGCLGVMLLFAAVVAAAWFLAPRALHAGEMPSTTSRGSASAWSR